MREKFDQYKHSNVQTAFDAFVKKEKNCILVDVG